MTLTLPLPQTMRTATRPASNRRSGNDARAQTAQPPLSKIRVFVAAENRLLREALTRVLLRQGAIEVPGTSGAAPLPTAALQQALPQLLLLTSRGSLAEDVAAIQAARNSVPTLPVLLIGTTADAQDFLHCVRAGISGYLPRDASAQQVRDAVQAIHAGEGVCPGPLCRALFEHLAHSAEAPPSGGARSVPRLTKREQQLIPLIARDLSNKEIAAHFRLSEATVKNHMHRLKHKLGAKDRTQIAQLWHEQLTPSATALGI
jgi:DNA-binding NarL/FixJ family response regulator